MGRRKREGREREREREIKKRIAIITSDLKVST